MNRRLLSFLTVLLLVLAAGIALIRSRSDVVLLPLTTPPEQHETTTQLETTTATSTAPSGRANALVVRVVDGDTFEATIDGEMVERKIRMLGINTPESVDPRRPVECFGKEASARLKQLLQEKRVDLEADPLADERDKYGRLLRNVYLEDGTDVNAAMVRDGYAYAYLSFPLTPARKSELKRLQDEAQAAGRGLWSPTTCRGKKTP